MKTFLRFAFRNKSVRMLAAMIVLIISSHSASAYNFYKHEIIQKSEITYSYNPNTRVLSVTFPYIFQTDLWDWLDYFNLYLQYNDSKGAEKEYRLMSMYFQDGWWSERRKNTPIAVPAQNWVRSANIEMFNNCKYNFPSNKNGVYGQSSQNQNAIWATVEITLPADFLKDGKFARLKAAISWAPDDYRHNNWGPNPEGNTTTNEGGITTGSSGVVKLAFIYDYMNFAPIVPKPQIKSITYANDHMVTFDLDSVEGQKCTFRTVMTLPAALVSSTERSTLGVQTYEFIQTISSGSKTFSFNWKNFVDNNYSAGEKLKDKNFAKQYLNKGYSDAETKRMLYSFFSEASFAFYVKNEKMINSTSYTNESAKFSFEPKLGQPHYAKAERVNTDKHIKLTWYTLGKAAFKDNSSVPFIIERSENGGAYKEISKTVTYPTDAVDNTIKTLTFTDTDAALAEGKTYTYRISRPPQGKTGWTSSASITAGYAINYNDMRITNVAVKDNGNTTTDVYWKCSTPGTTYKVYRRTNSESPWAEIASIATGSATKKQYNGSEHFYYTNTSGLTTCSKFEYMVKHVSGNLNFESAVATVTMGVGAITVSNYKASKGLYSDKVTIECKINVGGNTVIERRPYRSSAWIKVFEGEIAGDNKYWEDRNAAPGTIYEYRLGYYATCSGNSLLTFLQPEIGFRRSTGTVTGRVSFAGGSAVPNVKVRAKATNENVLNSGYSLERNSTEDKAGNVATVATKENIFNTKNNFSIQFWAYREPDGNKIVVSKAKTSTYIDVFRNANTRQVKVEIYKSGKMDFYDNVPYTNGTPHWFHVTVVRSGNTAACYIDGQKLGTKNFTPQNISDADFNADTIFNILDYKSVGKIDEVRFWTKALSDNEVANTWSRYLSGDEEGLAGYWKFDEGVDGVFYDYSYTDGIANERHGKVAANPLGGKASLSTDMPSESQLSYSGITDQYGNYVISGIPYANEGSTYRIIPTYDVHSFDPNEEILFLDPSAYVHNKVNFTDISSFTVNGQVFYENTRFPVEAAMIYVDGNLAVKDGNMIQTNNFGEFEVEVPIGNHYIEIKKNGHTFKNNGRFPATGTYLFNKPLEITDPFYDNTTVRVIGRVAGGPVEAAKEVGFNLSKNNIGTSSLTLKARFKETSPLIPASASVSTTIDHPRTMQANGKVYTPKTTIIRQVSSSAGQYEIVIKPDTLTGEYVADLIPEDFNVIYVQAGTITGTTPYVLPEEQLLPLELSAKAGATNYLLNPTGDSIRVADGAGGFKKEPKNDSVAYCGVTGKYIRRNAPEIFVTNISSKKVIDTLFGEKELPVKNKTDVKFAIIDTAAKKYKTNNMPVFLQNEQYEVEISVYEKYTKGTVVDKVPVIDGQVTVNNNFAAIANEIFELDTAGKVKYIFTGGMPSMTGTSDPNAVNTYTKTFNIVAATGENGNIKTNWRPEDAPLKGYLLGGAVTGSNFTTRGPKNILTILRDPAGSNSNSVFENTASFTTTTDYTYALGLGYEAELGVVFGTKVSVGLGVTTEQMDSENFMGAHLETSYDFTHSNTKETQTTFSSIYSTSEDPTYVGAMADVIVGYSENIVYSEAVALGAYSDDVPVQGLINNSKVNLGNGYYIAQRSAIDVSPEFETHFLYTVAGIENKIIPDLKKLRNAMIYPPGYTQRDSNNYVYVSKVPVGHESFGEPDAYDMLEPIKPTNNFTDSVFLYNGDIKGWKDVLAANEQDKLDAINNSKPLKNVSFEAGSSYESIETNELTTTITATHEWGISGGRMADVKFMAMGVGIKSTIKETLSTDHQISSSESKQTTQAYSYRLADENPGDFLTVDIYKSPRNWGPIFRTRGGQTSCPYEGADMANYFEPDQKHVLSMATAQIEKPGLTIEPATRSNVPGNKAAIFSLVLENNSEVGADVSYVIKVNESTNPNGAVLSIDGLPIGNGREILVPFGAKTYKTLSLARTREDVFDYEDIEISLRSMCDNSYGQYHPLIEATYSITAYFVPACGEINIKSPTTNFIVNQSQMDTNNISGLKGVLPIVISDYDVNNTTLKTISLYYKSASESDDKWLLLEQYSKTPTSSQKTLQGSTITYNWKMKDAPNRTYNFKAIATGDGARASESNIINVIKDDKSPKIFGKPQPSSGVLTADADISVTYDEEIDQSLILPELNGNIQVTGLLPGYTVQHNSGLMFDGTANGAEVVDKVNLNNIFTIDFWINRPQMAQAGTIFTHGTSDNYFEVGINEADKIVVNINGTVYTSPNPLISNQIQGTWAHLGVMFDGTRLLVYVNSTVLLDDLMARPYSNMSMLRFAKNINNSNYFRGNIQEFRIWSKAMDVEDMSAYRNITLTGKETYLYANWPLDEGFGSVAKDKVRNRNARVSAAWFVDPVGKAKGIAGNGSISIPMKNIRVDDDYTVEFWFKAPAANNTASEIALLTAGGNGLTMANRRDQFNLCFRNGKLHFDANAISTKISDANYLDNKWHHVAVAVNHTGNATFYVDGVAKNYRLGNTVGGLSGANFTMGACEGQTKLYGQFDEFRYWRSYRSEELITMNMTSKLQGNEAGLTAYYPFEKNGPNATIVATDENIAKDFSTERATVNAAVEVEGVGVKSAPAIESIPFTWALNRDKLVISLTERDDYVKRMENVVLTVSVKDLYDKYGNKSAATIWTAYVSKNQLKWSESELDFKVEENNGLTFEVFVNNNSGMVQDFTITQVPSWLTASITSGKIQPRSNIKVTFTVNKSLGAGTYEQQLYLNGSLLADVLKLRVKVGALQPEWTVDPSAFSNSMSIVGQLKIDDNFSTDKEDMVAAFIGDQCVGVAHPTYMEEYDAYYLFMNIYGESSGNLVFKAWNANLGRVFPALQTSIALSFVPNSVHGSVGNPVLFSTGSNIYEQSIALRNGWNWVSFSVNDSSFTNFEKTFSSLGNSVNIVKFANAFKQHGANNTWYGSLAKVEPGKMYNIQTSAVSTLKIVGATSNPTITLDSNWNWIGYVPSQSMEINDALAGLVAMEGDIVKSQTDFAMYTGTANGWIGTLEYMQPGKGYMYKSGRRNVSFNYPVLSASQAVRPMLSKTVAKAKHWEFNPSSYQSNMTIVAIYRKDQVECGAGFEIGVFDKKGVCRGSEVLQLNPATGRYYAYLTIMGDQAGEELAVKAYKTSTQEEFIIAQRIIFTPDAAMGTDEAPYVLASGIGSKTKDGIDADFINVYPNPTAGKLMVKSEKLKYGLALSPAGGGARSAGVDIKICNTFGICVATAPFSGSETEINLSHLAAGVYFVHIETKEGIIVRKIVKQ